MVFFAPFLTSRRRYCGRQRATVTISRTCHCIFSRARHTGPSGSASSPSGVTVMKVIIAGAGVGGLVTALMLHARGIDCEIYEQSDAVRELGVGINTLPHAIKELAELGLLERLDAVAIRTYELFYTNRLGQEIWAEPRGLDAGYDLPQFSIHRGRLHGVIYQAARARLGESRIHLNCRLQSFTQDDRGVTDYFFDRHGSHRHTARGD